MSKRVHFAPTNRIYDEFSEAPSTPSPSLTASSLASSPGPDILTPPPDDDDDDYTHIVYPTTPHWSQADLYPDPVTPKSMQIHFLLAYSPHSDPAFDYDLISTPTNIHGRHPFHAFAEHATSPPMSALVITHPLLAFDIDVTPPHGAPSPFVTVADILTCLYRHLRLPIHPSVYASLGEGERREGVDAAYYVRTGSILDGAERAQEERKGIKNVDLLMGCTRFLGLAGTLHGPGVWELNVA